MAAACVIAAVAPADAQPPTDTSWTITNGTPGTWSNAANWTDGVPTSTVNAYTGGSGANFLIGVGEPGKTLFIEGPVGGTSSITSVASTNGTLSLSDQLWINVTGGATLRIFGDDTTSPTVTAANVTLGADPGNSGIVILDSTTAGGFVNFTATNTITIGYDGSGSALYSMPELPAAAGTVAISATTIEASVLATAGASDYNYVGTYNSGHTLTATNLNLGIAGDQGGADNYGGVWSVANTALGVQATSSLNYALIADSGTFTNTGAFTVGVSGSNNTVYVGYTGYSTNDGALRLTGPNDLVIGSGSTADGNAVVVDYAGSSLMASANVIVGLAGHANTFTVDNGATAASGGARLGVNATAGGNVATVANGATWTMDGTVRVGDSGTGNAFSILSGGTVTLTGSSKNFFVGYAKSARDNTLTVSGEGSTISVKASDADLVVSANVGLGADATGNAIVLSDGGHADVNRLLVGSGGTLAGASGTVSGFTGVAAGGRIAPGALGTGLLGTLSFGDDVDLATQGGALSVDLGAGGLADLIIVSGSLSIAGAPLFVSAPLGSTGLAYEIAHYGTLAGTFGSITGVGDGWTIDYDYLGLNRIALIAPIPEIDPASLPAVLGLVAGSLGLLERRSQRRPRAAGHRPGGAP